MNLININWLGIEAPHVIRTINMSCRMAEKDSRRDVEDIPPILSPGNHLLTTVLQPVSDCTRLIHDSVPA